MNSSKDFMPKIKREVDQTYVYPYKKTKFVPPEDKTLLIMGQTYERISEYCNDFKDKPLPAGWAAYWGIPEFEGVTSAFKNDTGSTQNHQYLVDNFPDTIIQSALWIVGHQDIDKKTFGGNYDDVIKKYCDWVKSVNRPVYLRIGYEFDGPHNALAPDLYDEAYRYIVDFMRNENVENVAFVWHSYASEPYETNHISAWYPGDDYVDWVAISVFGHAYDNADFGLHSDEVLQFAKQHHKPVMIAESSPVFGIDKNHDDVWHSWFVNFFSFIYSKNIKAFSFINEDWTSLKIVGISGWKNSLLQNNASVSEAWFKEVSKQRYLKQSSELFKILGY